MEYHKMKRNIVVMSLTVVVSPSLLAGNLDSPAAPSDSGSAMYKLEDIYNRLNSGTEGTKRTGAFTEPSSGPGSTGKTLNEVMDKAPAKDNTNGASPSDVTTGKTYWGLKDGSWGLQTAPRYIDNDNGTVTDRTTGLIWLQDADCVGQQAWANVDTSAKVVALINGASCDNYTASTFNDWRLPTIQELQSVVDYNYSSPAMSNAVGDVKWATDGGAFSGVQSNFYWSSSIYATFAALAWYVRLDSGVVGSTAKTLTLYVWPVRGGQ
jgi:hypothetical protein